MWLKNKRAHYHSIAQEDLTRIEMMEIRYKSSLAKIQKEEFAEV
jgi:hypothetical protein